MTVHLDHEETAPENQNSMRMIYAGHQFLERLSSEKRLLDIGCNSGFLMEHLDYDPDRHPYRSPQYFGIDTSYELLEKARARDYEPKDLELSSADNIPYTNNWFDAFYMGEVLEHVREPVEAINEAYRVLKHGGFGIVTTPKKVEGFNPNHVQEYELNDMKMMLRDSHFRIDGISLVSQNPKKWFRLLMVFEVTKE